MRECCAQIELVERLITQPETFDIRKVLVELQTKKKLLMTFRKLDYITISEGLKSGAFKHPGVWVKPPEKKKEPKKEIPKVKEIEKAEIDQAAEIKSLKAKLKEAQETKIEEVKEEIPGE